ncbi:uncharacterized protein ACNLHF_021890 [Anomaloglossus baeobatrachus]
MEHIRDIKNASKAVSREDVEALKNIPKHFREFHANNWRLLKFRGIDKGCVDWHKYQFINEYAQGHLRSSKDDSLMLFVALEFISPRRWQTIKGRVIEGVQLVGKQGDPVLDLFSSSGKGTKEALTPKKMAERVSMNFPTLKHISENSTFIPVIPNTYKSTEMLWSALLDQAYAYDKSCISRCDLKKTKKRLVMLAKLVSTFEESISKSEHLETLASTRKAEEVTFHCQCCVENTKHIHTLETELRDRVECSAERGKQICMLESRILEKETYYSDMDKELLQLYTEINQFKNRVASTDALVSTLREDLAAKTQIIADLQQVISNLSRPDMNSMSTVPTKQVCVSGTAQEETAATVSTPPRDHRSGDSETRGQVERSLQFTPIPMEDRCSSRFQGQDYSWRCESRWDANPTTSNLPNCSERQEEFYPNHKSMERINFLLRICKEIPKYDPNVDPFTSCDIFEGHCNKYSVAPEYRMELFKLWLPTHLNQRYEATWKAHPRNGQYHSEEERLSLLMSLTTGHQDVTPDILTKFKPTINDEPLSLCSRFEAMYRKVTMDQGIGIPQGMIRMFVEKFPYLDTAIRLSAAREPSLTDAAMIIEQCRQDLLHNKKSIKIRQHVPVYVKSQDERAHHAKSSRVLPYIGQRGGIHSPLNERKSQTDSAVMFQKILCGFDKEWKTCPDRFQL